MKKLPYFPFYYLDWLSSSNVMMMSYEEKGLFIDMLCRCYNDDGLPDDNDKLQRLFRCDEKVLETVKNMFFSADGMLQNEKLEEIKKEQKVFVKNKSRAGKASAKARAAKKLDSVTGVEQVLNSVETESQQNSTNITEHNRTKQSITEQENIKDTDLKTSIDPEEYKSVSGSAYHEYMDIYIGIKGYDITKVNVEARSTFNEAAQTVSEEQILTAARDYKTYCEAMSKQIDYRKTVIKFLTEMGHKTDWLKQCLTPKGEFINDDITLEWMGRIDNNGNHKYKWSN